MSQCPLRTENANNNGQGTLYVIDVIEVLSKQVEFFQKREHHVPSGAEKLIVQSCYSNYVYGLNSNTKRSGEEEVDMTS